MSAVTEPGQEVPGDTPRDTLFGRRARWYLLAISGGFALLTLIFVLQCAWLERPLEAIEANGGAMGGLEAIPLIGRLWHEPRYCCLGDCPSRPDPWPGRLLDRQYALRHGCALWFERGPGDEELALVRDLACVAVLDVPNSSISDEGLSSLRGIRGLERLNLHGTRLSGAGLRHLRDLPRLRELILSHTLVGDDGLASLEDLPALAALDLSRTLVSSRGLEHLARFPSLRELDLSGTAVDDEALRVLARLPLTELDLRGMRITDAGLSHLEQHPTLAKIDLRRTAITDAAVQLLRRSTHISEIESCERPISDEATRMDVDDDDRTCP